MLLILRGPSRINSVKALLGMASERLMSFKYIPKEGKESLSLNRAKISLIQCLEEYI